MIVERHCAKPGNRDTPRIRTPDSGPAPTARASQRVTSRRGSPERWTGAVVKRPLRAVCTRARPPPTRPEQPEECAPMSHSHPSPASWNRPMVARLSHEQHRTATMLELFFDLCFVTAVAQAAGAFEHELAEGRIGHGVLGYAMVFFAIWCP